MEFLAQLSGNEVLKKMQYGVANPQIAELFDDSENIEKVRVFNAFVEVFSGKFKTQTVASDFPKLKNI